MVTTGGKDLLDPRAMIKKLSLKRGDQVGDLGCGPAAHFTIPLAELVGQSGKVYAVDVLKSALSAVESRARQEGVKNVETVWSNLEIVGATKVPAASLDGAMLVNVLFHAEADKRVPMFKEAVRLLKPGAKLLVIDWKPEATTIGPATTIRLSLAEARAAGEQAGLNVLEEFETGDYHYGLIFQKT